MRARGRPAATGGADRAPDANADADAPDARARSGALVLLGLWASTVAWMSSISPPSGAPSIPHLDKLLHAAVFAVGGALAVRASAGALPAPRATRRREAIAAVSLVAGFGATDELHQLLVPGRHADVADWVADAVGAALGGAVAFALHAGSGSARPERPRDPTRGH